MCYHTPKKYSEALEAFTRSLKIRLNLKDCDKAEIERTRRWKGKTLYELEEWKQAVAELKPAVEFLKKMDGHEPEVLAETMSMLGIALKCDGDVDGAQRNLTEALVMMEKCYGRDDPRALEVLEVLGDAFMSKLKYKSSSERYARVIHIRDKHSCWGSALQSAMFLRKCVAIALRAENHEEVIRIAPRLLVLWEKQSDRNEEMYIDDMINYGVSLASTGQFEEALRQLERGVRLCEPFPESQKLLTALRIIAEIYSENGFHERAVELTKRAIAVAEKLYGKTSKEWLYLQCFLLACEEQVADPKFSEKFEEFEKRELEKKKKKK